MAFALLAFDGTDAGAPARRAAARDAHVAFITAEAAAGRLRLSLPLRDEAGRTLGSLTLLDVPDRAGVAAYLAAEPLAAGRVWRRVQVRDFRIAPLPYRPWPEPTGQAPPGRTHTVVVAFDGTDPGAEARRGAARPRHMDRIRPFARDGTLLVGGALLDAPGGRMIGSIAVTRHATDAEAAAWWAEDPYMAEGVWRDVARWGTALRPLPYPPLPGEA
ncbi:YciI family protein [Falsiroseomonas sp. CW058]|uniref:YciI family protein n=1 Tax=Falsiroseomonas sp. CW058 TaxID=3388664 RepID=UPI003D31478D